MKKLFLVSNILLGAIAALVLFGPYPASAACTPVTSTYPGSLDTFVSNNCIPSAWANALEAKLGITSSSVTSSLDYQINHLFTSYSSEIIKATSTQGLLQTLNNLSDLTNLVSARSNLGLGSIATFNSTDFVASSTNIVNTFNGSTGTTNLYVSGPGLSIATGTGSTTITYSSSSLSLGSASLHPSSDFLASSTNLAPSTTIPTTYVASFNSATGTVTGVSSFTGQGCVTAANSTGTVSLTVTCISGNQTITFGLSGDATGTATGTTAITDSITVTGLNGKALPANTTGTLQFSGNAWKINLATSSLGQYDASGTLSSYVGSSCGGGQFVTGFSATGTVACGTPAGTGVSSFNTLTGAVTYAVNAGTGISVTTSTTSSTVTLNINGGSVQTCTAGQLANSLSATGTITCQIAVQTIGGVNTSTITISGTANEINIATTTNSITLSTPQAIGTGSSPTFGGLTVNGNSTTTSLTVTTTSAATIPNISAFTIFPTPSQLTAGVTCGTTTGVTEVGNCFNDIYAVASGTTVYVGPYVYSSSQWTNPINVTTNDSFLTILCTPNITTFNWGGVGTSTFWNYGSSASASGESAHTYGSGPQGCAFYGPSRNGTTTFAVVGGTNGAEGFNASNNRIQGFGLVWSMSNNQWVTNINFSQFLGDGQIINQANLSNAGENSRWIGDTFGDASSTASNLNACINLAQGVSTEFDDPSLDNCGMTIGTATGVHISGGHVENPGTLTNPSYPSYQYFTINGGINTVVKLDGVTFYNDASSTTSTPASNIAMSGGELDISGGSVQASANASASIVGTFVSLTYSTSTVINMSGFKNITNSLGTAGVSSCVTGYTCRANIVLSSSTITADSPITRYANGTSQMDVGLSNSGSASPFINVVSNNSFTLSTNNTERFRADSTGRIGINTLQAPSTTEQIMVQPGVTASATLMIGTSGSASCFEMTSATGTGAVGTISYLYVSFPSGGPPTLVSTTTKPTFCQ